MGMPPRLVPLEVMNGLLDTFIFWVCALLGLPLLDVLLGRLLCQNNSGYINASFCSFPIVTSGLECSGFFSARIKYCVARMAAYIDDIFGIIHVLVKNSTVSEIRSAFFLGMYFL